MYYHITMCFFNRGLSTYHHQDHRALDDVLVTVSLWFHLKKRLDILHNSPGPSAYIHQKLLHLQKKGSTCIVDTSHHTYTSRDQSVRVMNSKITFYALISSMPAQEVQKLLFMWKCDHNWQWCVYITFNIYVLIDYEEGNFSSMEFIKMNNIHRQCKIK